MQQRDWMTKRGATQLARALRLYWADKGMEVDAWVEKVFTSVRDEQLYGDSRGEMYCIRSNMINGLPPEAQQKRAA